MRLSIICALCVLAAPVAAQQVGVTTVNGVRVWSPAPRPPLPPEPPDPQTTASTTTDPRHFQTINGVRVWSPRLPPEPIFEPPPPVSITINVMNAAPAYEGGPWSTDYDGAFWSPGYWPAFGAAYGTGRFRNGLHGSFRRQSIIRSPVGSFRGRGGFAGRR